MSTGLECEFIEPEAGQWYYLLQSPFCAVDAFDWRDEADTFGPFVSYQKALDHLNQNHANPGGHICTPNKNFRMKEVYRQAITGAK